MSATYQLSTLSKKLELREKEKQYKIIAGSSILPTEHKNKRNIKEAGG